MNYITQTELEHYLDVTLTGNGINQFNDMLPRMQDMIDQECNRTWNITNPLVETYDAFRRGNPPQIEDTFFLSNTVSKTPANSSYPQAGGVISVIIGKMNGQGGTALDLTYVYARRTHIKFWSYGFTSNMFNPLGYNSVEITYNSDDASLDGTTPRVPGPIKEALIEWIARKIKTSEVANKEAVRVQADSVHVIYKPDEVGGIPDFVRRVCSQYRLPSVDRL